jgi:hypothetical protein
MIWGAGGSALLLKCRPAEKYLCAFTSERGHTLRPWLTVTAAELTGKPMSERRTGAIKARDAPARLGGHPHHARKALACDGPDHEGNRRAARRYGQSARRGGARRQLKV